LIFLNAGGQKGPENNKILKERTMAKKSKKLVKNGSDYELVGQIRGSANQIWLAGLGAFAGAQKESGKLFDALVKQGEVIQNRATKAADETISEVKATASKSWDKVEQVFEDGVARALHTLNVPTKKEFDKLSRRVGELESTTKRRSTTMATARHKGRRSAHS
jgi:poly(hydroxyalkanoate) granule-associated protein